jgi:hypothetical protein
MKHRDLKIGLGEIVVLTPEGLEVSTVEKAGVYYAIPKQKVEAGVYPVAVAVKKGRDDQWEKITSTLEVAEPMELMYVNKTAGEYMSVCFEVLTEEPKEQEGDKPEEVHRSRMASGQKPPKSATPAPKPAPSPSPKAAPKTPKTATPEHSAPAVPKTPAPKTPAPKTPAPKTPAPKTPAPKTPAPAPKPAPKAAPASKPAKPVKPAPAKVPSPSGLKVPSPKSLKVPGK